MTDKKTTTERLQDKNSYNLYCVNIYGSGLNSIKDEFKRQVETGLRQSVFILDLDDVENTLNQQQQQRNSKLQTEFQKNYASHLMNACFQQIQRFCKEYVLKKKKIADELKFDLNQYWLNNKENKLKLNLGDTVSIKEAKKTQVGKKSSDKLPPLTEEVTIQCSTMPTTLKEHNRVGQPEMLSKLKFIKDEPTMGKLYIIIVGQMTDGFFLDLIRRDQPLRAIVHFVPKESKYDILMENNKLESFIMETLDQINASIYELRQEVRMKPVGLFFYQLPIISKCLATKYAPEIFNQLSWGIYDLEMLQQQYDSYYYRPYQETDVAIPPTVDLKELYHVAEILSVEGHFQKMPLPAMAADLASVLFYFNSLLNTFGSPDGETEGNEVSLISMMGNSQSIISRNNDIRDAFSSITKIYKFERIFLAENNKLLINMLQYVDHSVFRNIYLSCLDYNIVRQYVLSALKTDSVTSNSKETSEEDLNLINLPQYFKYYANDDCCYQRLFELRNEFDDCQIMEICPGCKLYTFKRTHNKTIVTEGMTVIPTRLCFRDFTLFQMDEFLDNLKEVETQKTTQREQHIQSVENKLLNIDIDSSIYVRRNSLKALKMQKQNKFVQPNRKSNSPAIKSSMDKKASLSTALRSSQQWMGLPPDHHILQGYNLEDVHQEVTSKTSKYLYENGYVQLYEEKWCFQEMNKELIFCINNNSTLYLNGLLYTQTETLCKNIRLITKNNISIRILNDSNECSKIVMNYPNGLTVYHQEMLCEQIWCSDQKTPNEEVRRICTPYGAIIVFFKSNEMILVMRYNGEVYRLYQYEFPEEEEEQDLISNFSENLQEQSSGIKDMKSQGDTRKIDKNTENKPIKKEDKTKTEKLNPKDVNQAKSVDANLKNSNQSDSSSVKIKISSLSRTLSDHLKASIKYELDYLNFISSKYQLNYLHFIVTTTQGKRLHLTNTGKIFEEKRCDVQEWHDYFANEAYCQRSDGVKMIWTKDTFKCYHKDGSVLTTLTKEVYETADIDEFESLISKSSSHINLAKRENEEISNPTDLELEKHEHEQEQEHSQKPSDLGPITLKYSSYLMDEFAEEHEDTRYISYTCNSCLLQHHHYADVNLEWLNSNPSSDTPSVLIEIIGIDDIRIYTDTEKSVKVGEYVNVSDLDSFRSGLDLDEKYPSFSSVVKEEVKLKINVSIGKNLLVTTDMDGCEIFAVMPHTVDHDQIIECCNQLLCNGSLILKLKFEDCINDVFKYIVNEIALFKNTVEKSEEILFLEKTIENDCKKRGFEFLNNKPLLSKHNYEISNCVMDVKPLMTVNELMTNTFEWYDLDMQKFPRFQKFRTKKFQNLEMKFPRVLSTNVYCKIPNLLQNTCDISKFLEPFDNIHFKKLRYKLKDLLDLYLNPKMQFKIKLLYSTKNWRKKHWEHQRRKFTEQQRMGLYHAIIKYKKYPNYWNFLQDYRGQVAYIDFLEFMQHTC